MLSIGSMSAGHSKYYLDLAREDYYAQGGEPPGIWYGDGAHALGLEGHVTRDALVGLFHGASQDGRALIQNAGLRDHQPGWDLTFSAPKSVSVLWGTSDSATRKLIAEAHHEAVKVALGYLESSACTSRIGKGGHTRVPASMVAALFEHGTSRAQDPQLHTHALIMNVGVRQDGSTATILSKPLYQSKMAAGAAYRVELSSRLQKALGIQVRPVRSWFEVEGVSTKVLESFSTRRAEIEEKLNGASSAKASEIAAFETRSAKAAVPREELVELWAEKAGSLGFDSAAVMGRQNLWERPSLDLDTEVTQLTESDSSFTERDAIRRACEASQETGVPFSEVQDKVKRFLGSSEVICLGTKDGNGLFTTAEMLRTEDKLLRTALNSKSSDRSIDGSFLEQVSMSRPSMSDEQKNALRHILIEPGSIKVVSGLAGTGKTFLLGAAREAWESAGYRVLGTALSGKAAQGLEEGSGISSDTLAKRFFDLQSPSRLTLGPKTVIVLDEAGMVGTKQMAELTEHADRSGAKLILVGDSKQLQPIAAGGPFAALGEVLGDAKLTDIRRQKEDWARQAVHDFSEGNAARGLGAYAKKGLLSVEDGREAVHARVVAEYRAANENYSDKLVLTTTNRDSRDINRKIQSARQQEGELGEPRVYVSGECIHEGDRVLFTRNSRLYGVKNGSLGTVASVDADKELVCVSLDSEERTTISLKDYDHLKLGYAVTTHKAQGITTEKAFVLLGGSMQDREVSYVQGSRAKTETRFYAEANEAGDDVEELVKTMTKSRQKCLARMERVSTDVEGRHVESARL